MCWHITVVIVIDDVLLMTGTEAAQAEMPFFEPGIHLWVQLNLTVVCFQTGKMYSTFF